MKKYAIALIAAGLLTGCNQSVQTASEQFNALPPAVQKTARAQAPDAEIVSVSTINNNGATDYQIKFRENGSTPTVVIAPDGSLVSSQLPQTAGMIKKFLTPTGATGTEFSALPLQVQTAIQSHAPKAQISSITRHDVNGRVIYEVQFKDSSANPPLRIADDGTIVQK